MIKLVYCFRRRPGMPLDEFIRYWHDVHGERAKAIPGLRRLVQTHPLAENRTSAAGFDGVAELWFDDLAALERARASPAWAAITADEANFIDPESPRALLGRERTIVGD